MKSRDDTTHMCEGTQKIQRLLFLLEFLLACFYTLDRGGFNVRQTRQSPKVKNEEIKKKKIGILRGCSISYLSHPWERKKLS